MRIVTAANILKSLRSLHFLRVTSSLPLPFKDKQQFETQPHSATYSPDNDHKSRMELKRFFENRIKKRVKEQHANDKFHDLMKTVISNAETLGDAYNCIRISSNTLDTASSSSHNASVLDDLAEELGKGNFDVSANTTSFPTRRGSVNKEISVLPNLRLKVVLEAMKIALECYA